VKSAFLDKLIERLDRLDSASLEAHFLRLARERGLLETIFNAIHEGIVVLDDHGRITYANRAAEELLGFDAENAAGDPIARYLSGIDWPLLLQLDEGEWSRVMSREIEISYPRRRFLQFYLVPLGVVDSTEGGAVLILRDVTRERERANQELESERLRAITLLSGSLAHEIGNPLNSLNIHLQLLRREIHDLPPEERQRLEDLVRVAGDEVARLDSIISQFLRAVRPAPPKLEPTDLRALLEDTIEFMKPEISNRDVIVHLDAPDDLPAASADRVQMRQAFFNIIKNAIQAMPGGGVLKVSLAPTERFVAVSFRDTGSGIDPENIGRVFEPYHTTRAGGSGLGLMIVQRVLRDHGGEIEIHSEPGRGTTVTLFVPREDRRVRLLEAPRRGRSRNRRTGGSKP